MCLWFNRKCFYSERQLLCLLGGGEGFLNLKTEWWVPDLSFMKPPGSCGGKFQLLRGGMGKIYENEL